MVGLMRALIHVWNARSLKDFGVLAFVLCTVFFSSSCKQGEDFKAPQFAGKDAWASELAGGEVLQERWWQRFESRQLDALVERALADNPDLEQSLARVQFARAQLGVDRSAQWPQLALKGGTQWERISGSVFGANLPPGVSLPALQRDRWQGLLSLNYEFDFWGRVARQREASQARVLGMEARVAAQRLSVVAELAAQFVQLCSLDAQLAVLKRAIALRADALSLQESRRAAGLANDLEAERARTEWQLARADLQEVIRQRARVANGIAVLCGASPAELVLPAQSMLPKLPLPKRPLPATLLLRRPDLRAAAAQLQEAQARIGVARADFLPRFVLVANGGFDSVGAQDFLDWRSRAASLGPQIDLPLFQGGRLRAQLQAAQANHAAELAGWRKALLIALQEVENATVDWQSMQRQIEASSAALEAASKAESLARLRHDKGLASYFEVVDAQRVVLSTELALKQIEGAQVVAAVQLLRALGGGWQ